MSTAPHAELDLSQLYADPYPIFGRLRRDTPIVFVPALRATLILRRDDILTCGRLVNVFSNEVSDLMNQLMGTNMMRKDAAAHLAERQSMSSTINPKAVKTHWLEVFAKHAESFLSQFTPGLEFDAMKDFALPYCAECLKSVTGLVNVSYTQMNEWSQAEMDGMSNILGDAEVDARCRIAVAAIDEAIDEMLPEVRKYPNQSLISVLAASDMPLQSLKANIKLAISGGLNEPRTALAGAVWALLTHAGQLDLVRAGSRTWLQVFEEYIRWLAPITFTPREVKQHWFIRDIQFSPGDKVLLVHGSGNRDEKFYERPDEFDIQRDASQSLAFGTGPHFCAGSWISKGMVAEVGLPYIFSRIPGLKLRGDAPISVRGFGFRSVVTVPAIWENG